MAHQTHRRLRRLSEPRRHFRRNAGRLIHPSGGLGGSRGLFYSLPGDATSPITPVPRPSCPRRGAVLRQVVPGRPSTGWLPARHVGGPPALKGGFGVHYGLYEPGSLRRTLGTRRPSLGPPGGGCPPQCQGWAAHPSGLIQAMGRYCLYRTLVRRLFLYGSRGAKTHEGEALAPPSWRVQRLALPRTWSRQAVKGGAGHTRPAASTLDYRHRRAVRHRDGWGEQHGWPSRQVEPPRPPRTSLPGVGAARRGYWSGPRGVPAARLHRLRLRRHPAAQPDALPPARRKPGMCRRSPPACDRWHIRQPVPAARFTAVLPRGSGETQEGPAGTGRG